MYNIDLNNITARMQVTLEEVYPDATQAAIVELVDAIAEGYRTLLSSSTGQVDQTRMKKAQDAVSVGIDNHEAKERLTKAIELMVSIQQQANEAVRLRVQQNDRDIRTYNRMIGVIARLEEELASMSETAPAREKLMAHIHRYKEAQIVRRLRIQTEEEAILRSHPELANGK